MCVCAEEHQGDDGVTTRLERGSKSHDLHMYCMSHIFYEIVVTETLQSNCNYIRITVHCTSL